MESIDFTNSIVTAQQGQLSKRNVKKKEKTKKTFSSVIKEQHEQKTANEITLNTNDLDTNDALEKLLDNVHSAGDELKKGNPTLQQIHEYKQAVRKFMQYVLHEGFSVKEEKGRLNPQTLQQKKYTAVEIINKELDKLAAGILQRQSSQMEILKRIDEINGLLIDLMS